MNDVLLDIQGMVKRFGALVATNNVNLAVRAGSAHAIIGPNGAGKTTLVAQISGLVQPSSGNIIFCGENITQLAPYRRARLGLARSFQITNVFAEFTVEDNVALAVQAHSGSSFSLWKPARLDMNLRSPALEVLRRVGLEARKDVLAGALSHGEKRHLEIAMVLVTRPKLLLLDEPLAGIGPDEARTMIQLLLDLKREYAMILIEHDLKAVFAIADEISVLVRGSIIATGGGQEIRSNPEVRRAYLGI